MQMIQYYGGEYIYKRQGSANFRAKTTT